MMQNTVPIQFLYRRFPYPDSTTPVPLPTIPLLQFPYPNSPTIVGRGIVGRGIAGRGIAGRGIDRESQNTTTIH